MVIEWLKFRVKSQLREEFVQKDAQIWTAFLASVSGFLGKEVWIHPDISDEVVFIVRWATREQWKSIPLESLEATEEQFAQQIGKDNYQMIESSEYQVRKFAR